MKNTCKTSFYIVGTFDPDVVTERLGIRPDRSWKKGDLRRDGTRFDFAHWEGCTCEDYDVYTENQMDKTVSPLLDKIDVLNDIRNNNEVEFFLSVVPELCVKEITPCLAPSMTVIDFCHDTRTKIDVDLYLYK
ncbi:MAG: DUF4279 domain-containing protein [Clostridia bacterium]|nr:DUF4279 domain-containing protein [Clostridia bacterium]